MADDLNAPLGQHKPKRLLNLPVSAPVLAVGHDDAGWCAGSSTFEHSPASLVLAWRERS